MEFIMPAASALRHALAARPRLSVRGMVHRLAAYDARRRERHHLAELDDRMLRDVGLTRADVFAELRRPLPW
jgi:uncharacterized protein YjiS (DUF1127 family)